MNFSVTKGDLMIKIYCLEYTMLQMTQQQVKGWQSDDKSFCIQLVFKSQGKNFSKNSLPLVTDNNCRVAKVITKPDLACKTLKVILNEQNKQGIIQRWYVKWTIFLL